MRKIIFLLFLACTSIQLMGANADLFDLNEEQLEAEFHDLSKLEDHVLANSSSLATIIEQSPRALDGLAFSSGKNPMLNNEDFTFEIEGFLWGFLCCPVGCFVIAINKNKSRDQKLSYWIGVAASSVISLVYNLTLAPSYYY